MNRLTIHAALVLCVQGGPAGQSIPVSSTQLTPSNSVTRELSGGRAHSYTVSLRSWQFIQVTVEQAGIDVLVAFLGPDGKQLLEVDSPNGDRGPEFFSHVSELPGTYEIRVHAVDSTAPSGRYIIQLNELRAAGKGESLLLQGRNRVVRGDRLDLIGTAEASRDAIREYLSAVPLLREAGDAKGEGAALDKIGQVFAKLSQSDSALMYLQRALAIQRQAGDRYGAATSLHSTGDVLIDLGRLDSALSTLRTALAIRAEIMDTSGEASTLNSIGLVFNYRGNPDSALAYYHLALRAVRHLKDVGSEGGMLNNIASILGNLGQTDSAFVYYHRSLAIRREVRDRLGEGITLNNIGSRHAYVGRRDSAVTYYRLSGDILREVGQLSSVGWTLNNIGRELSDMGKPDSALVYYAQALDIFKQVKGRNGEGAALHNAGLAHLVAGRPDSAMAHATAALDIRREVRDRPGEGATLNLIGFILRRAGRHDSALTYLAQGLSMARETRRPADEATMLRGIGLTHLDAARKGAKGLTASAAAYFDSASAIRATLAARAGGEANRIAAREAQVGLIEGWTLAWLSRGPEVGSKRSALAALAAVERGRSQALLELMRKASPEARAGGDLAEEGRLLLESGMSRGAGVISYLVTADTLLIWFARPGQDLQVFRQPVSRDTLTRLVRDLRKSLGDASMLSTRMSARRGLGVEEAALAAAGITGSFDATSPGLAHWLLPEELISRLAGLRELVIVSHSSITLVPFAALPINRRGTLLGARFAVRYAPSLAVLAEVEGRPRAAVGAPRDSALVVGNPAMPSRSDLGDEFELGDLPEAEAEGRWVAQQLGADVLHGARATESEVRERLASAPIIHFATHGYAFATDAGARRSFVALAPSPAHDGFLTVAEILDDTRVRLSADLVVLSACQTGLGDLKEAEGTIGLQRAFLAKGARSLLVSLWNVSDQATRLLMQSFYRHWLDGTGRTSKAEALRRAQEEIRKTSGFEHPRFWAAFQLVGAS